MSVGVRERRFGPHRPQWRQRSLFL